MNPNNLIEEKFERCYAPLFEEQLIKLNSLNTPSLNNVIRGLQKECFAIMLIDDTKEIIYRLLYANGVETLQGDLLELNVNDTNRDNLLFYFSQFLSHNYKSLDAINVFNTFQSHTRTMLEVLGFLTVAPTELGIADNNLTLITKCKKGIIPCDFIDKVQFYKDFFGCKKTNVASNQEHVYLMLNKRNDLIKIGCSSKPMFREKTLQAQEPEIAIIASWQVEHKLEKQLHQIFAHKRERGEWFDLNFTDLKKIKSIMESVGSSV